MDDRVNLIILKARRRMTGRVNNIPVICGEKLVELSRLPGSLEA
jgi:hypothetical protein